MSRSILLVYPEIPPTYWSLRYALGFIGAKAAYPPLGLLTVAAMLPDDYDVKLVDMNVEKLRDRDVAAADLVLTSSMIVQQESLNAVIRRCRAAGTTVVAGGPYPTACHREIEGVDHFVLNEAEVTLAPFLSDFEAGRAKRIYSDERKPDIGTTETPRFDLLRIKRYSSMALQFSRGCPHDCEFCDIVELFGHKPRTKSPDQFVTELDALYLQGYRGTVFVVDDNFIGNRKAVRKLLPAIEGWQRRHGRPFDFLTEATVILARDEELMNAMVKAGFTMVFLGLETPSVESLKCANKMQNVKPDLLASVRSIQTHGMEVLGGFIVGFDTDREDIFDRQVSFIQRAGIPTAMVGLLTALPNTRLYRRLLGEKRLLGQSNGNNVHSLMVNFRPAMDLGKLIDGYKRLLAKLYSPKPYFDRCLKLLQNLKPHAASARRIGIPELRAFILSLFIQTFSSYGFEYWKFLARAFVCRPRLIAESVALAIKGHHFFKITQGVLAVDRFKLRLDSLADSVRERFRDLSLPDLEAGIAELERCRLELSHQVRKEYRRLHKDFRRYVDDALAEFDSRFEELQLSLAGQLAKARAFSPTARP